jgi:catechol 2,3-dioxygenase-like lactoylglutathione lyase family enzyme
MITIRHVGISVIDIDVSVLFYRDLLGFKIVKDVIEEGDYIDNFSGVKGIRVRVVKMSDGNGGLIELLKYLSHDSGTINRKGIVDAGISHFALTVKNLEKLYDEMRKVGVDFNAPPQLSPDGYAKVTFCNDPDGNLIELVEVLK